MSDFNTIMWFVAGIINTVITMLQSVEIADTGYSVFTMFMAFLFLDLVIWFIQRFLDVTGDDKDEGD